MERLSKTIRGLNLLSPEEIACAAWPAAVGKRIAAHTRAAKVVRERLVIECEDHIWQHQLFAMQRHVLDNLARILGAGLITELEFRVLPRRRQPQRAAQATPGLPVDEADAIPDPIMRGLYRAQREKAGA